MRADDLSLAVVKALMERNPRLKSADVDDIIWAATGQIAEQKLTLGRQLSIMADMGFEIPGCSVDRMCIGSLTTITFGCQAVAAGTADVIIADGVEHMGHLPMGHTADPNPALIQKIDPSLFSMGMTAENLAAEFGTAQEEQDRYAFKSQQKAASAIKAGKMEKMIVPIKAGQADGTVKICDMDEQPRPDTSLEKLATLSHPFKKPSGTVTAGNSSGLNDGAAGVLITSRDKAEELGIKPLMRWVTSAAAGMDPRIMGIGPVPAVRKALKLAGLSLEDIGLIELNEASAVQCIHNIKKLGIDESKLNIWGGAIAYGHPLAASGARLAAFLAHQMAKHPEVRYGPTAMCVGLGQGMAAIWGNMRAE